VEGVRNSRFDDQSEEFRRKCRDNREIARERDREMGRARVLVATIRYNVSSCSSRRLPREPEVRRLEREE